MTLSEFPLQFDPHVDDEVGGYLTFEPTAGGERITWSEIGESVFVPTHEWSVPLRELEAKNGGRFKLHGSSGFSLGRYHEFLVDSGKATLWGPDTTLFRGRLGTSAHLSFGVATPLMAHLFQGFQNKYTGLWSEIATVRLIGVDLDNLEAALVSAFSAHLKHVGSWPRLVHFSNDFGDEDEENDLEENAPPQKLHLDVEPLRFLNSAMLQGDSAAACVNLYRIIEYYAFYTTAQQMSTLRHDRTISDVDFSRRMVEVVFKDEKSALHKTVNVIADQPLLEKAVAYGIIANAAAGLLTEALYSFRNSIVHGKFGSGFATHSTPVLDAEPTASKWQPILADLATKAIEHFGSTA